MIDNDIQIIQLTSSALKEWRENNTPEMCPICKREMKGPCVDHQHSKRVKGSGKVRGVICTLCNFYLGKVENSAVRIGISSNDLVNYLENVLVYLKQPHTNMIHPSERPKEPKLNKNLFKKLQKLYTIKYPKRKPLVYPASSKVTSKIQELLEEFQLV